MNNKTAGELVADILRKKILSGEIPHKTKLTQSWIADKLGISRMPIREALLRLEFEGLIERLDNRHTRVIGVNEKMISSRLRFLIALESQAAISIAKGKCISNIISRLKKCVEVKVSPDNELLFHRKLFQMSGERFLNHVYCLIGEPVLEVIIKNRGIPQDRAFSYLKEIMSEIVKQDELKIYLSIKKYYSTLQWKGDLNND